MRRAESLKIVELDVITSFFVGGGYASSMLLHVESELVIQIRKRIEKYIKKMKDAHGPYSLDILDHPTHLYTITDMWVDITAKEELKIKIAYNQQTWYSQEGLEIEEDEEFVKEFTYHGPFIVRWKSGNQEKSERSKRLLS